MGRQVGEMLPKLQLAESEHGQVGCGSGGKLAQEILQRLNGVCDLILGKRKFGDLQHGLALTLRRDTISKIVGANGDGLIGQAEAFEDNRLKGNRVRLQPAVFGFQRHLEHVGGVGQGFLISALGQPNPSEQISPLPLKPRGQLQF